MRNAIQALQILVRSPRSNPSLPTPVGHSNSEDRLLAKSSSYLPDGICWDPPLRLTDVATQTDWPIDLLELWVRDNAIRVVNILGLDPDILNGVQRNSLTPSPSSPPPPPYEPLSSIGVTPPRSPLNESQCLTSGYFLLIKFILSIVIIIIGSFYFLFYLFSRKR